MDRVIDLKDLSYRYLQAEEPSLKEVNLAIDRGKLVALMGPTGAGKTTLCLCLKGLVPQLLEGELTGEVTISGKDLRKHRVQAMARHIGLVLQDPETQIFGLTVREDTAFGPRNLALPKEEITQRVDQALARVGLAGYEERNTWELSGGEKQRLALAGILAMEPEILVLDEPAAELDPAGRAEIYAAIDNLRREKKLTILVVEHSGEEIINRADEVVVLDKGEIVWRGLPGELFRQIPLLESLGLRPLPVALLGWSLYQRGWISFAEIPLDVAATEALVRKLVAKASPGKLGILRVAPGQKEPCRGKGTRAEPVVLTVSNLSYRYPSGHRALQGVNLAVRRGEFVALIGPNGAGKTTLAKHFNGLLKPGTGEVVVCGLNTREHDTPRLAQVVGYVFQNPDHQIFSVSVEKELEYGLKKAGLPSPELKERVEWALQLTGLEKYRQVHPFTLGKGERQLIAVASILALRPQILVIDEPTTGLDWTGVRKIMSLIAWLQEQGTTVIMISHDMEIVARYAQRVVVMKDGGIFLDGGTREVFANIAALREAQVVPPQLARLTGALGDLGFQEPLLDEQEFAGILTGLLEGATCS